jgi:hypothetical protein
LLDRTCQESFRSYASACCLRRFVSTYAGLLLIAAIRPVDLLRQSIDLVYHCVGSLVDLGVVRSCLLLYTMVDVGSTKYG